MAQYIKVVQNISRIEINWRRFPFYENEFLIRFYDNVVGFIDAREKFFFTKKISSRKAQLCLAAVALFS